METKVQCLVVDDEPLAIRLLKMHLSKFGTVEVAGAVENAVDAIDFLNTHKVDLMFLDIHMPEMKGTELLRSLKNPPAVIFTTAYRQYALEGYDLSVLDYLVKPISFGRLTQAVEKYFAYHIQGRSKFLRKAEKSEEFLYLQERSFIHKIPLIEIVYAESMGDNLTFYLNDRNITSRCTVSSVEEFLSQNGFLRIHRSYVVSLKRITSFGPVSVFIGKKELPIGKTYRKNVLEQLNYKAFFNK
ncbi:LytR/AlgR family response regulator transcription factor [Maribellus maritimus]|uniref:LytR/AlgR family response regulator transcription factor n=1 Tax=Maribellus maritimus TaxID=2870838 RepID=UPI001EEADEEC|nr:response regulator transcription factor [Maribellus maritimus]MCG6190999.1 response regulator transcription factor [Maribellus maritimus]